MGDRDPFDNLDSLRLTPETAALARPVNLAPARRRGPRITSEFYLCPVTWADRAMSSVSSKEQLILALRLYRCWKLREPGGSIIVASNAVLAGPGFRRETKRRTIEKLQAAGLLEVVQRGRRGRSPRVRVIE
jgi:hypothetical protein